MRIAVYLPDIKPEAGGSSSLLKTIQQEILAASDLKDEYVFLYYGGRNEALRKEYNGFVYFNLDFYAPRLSIAQRAKNKLKRKLGICVKEYSKFDALAKDQSVDLFWLPAPFMIDVSYPYIYTIWDLGHRTTPFFPEVSRSGWLWEEREACYQKMVYKASYIITGNEEGKKEILSNYLVPEKKIRISPFPVASFCRGNEAAPSFAVPDEFFFYPAQFWPHKNHIRILEALVILREKFNLKPVVFFTGSDKGNKKYIEDKIAEYGLQGQAVMTGFLKDEELKYLYTHARAMIFASLMGPNNMPPIEGAYLNCPIIITNLDGHKEQLKDAALYFDGYNADDLAAQMKKLLSNSAARNKIIKKEKVLAKEFEKVNYFSCIRQIVSEFSAIRKTWGAPDCEYQ